MWNEKINLNFYYKATSGSGYVYVRFVGDETKEYSYYKTNNGAGTVNEEFDIPIGTEYIEFVSDRSSMYMDLYEITIINRPSINQIKKYPVITPSEIIAGYEDVTINYFQTALEKLYKINDGEWLEYNDEVIKLNVDDVIVAKSVDKNNNISQEFTYTSTLKDDALPSTTFDNNTSSLLKITNSPKLIYVTEDMWNEKINLNFYYKATSGSGTVYVRFVGEETKEYSYYTYNNGAGTVNQEFEIPSGTEYIEFVSDRSSMYMELYDISL